MEAIEKMISEKMRKLALKIAFIEVEIEDQHITNPAHEMCLDRIKCIGKFEALKELQTELQNIKS